MDGVSEGEALTVLETIGISGGTAILRLPDLDGRPMYFPSYAVSVETEFGWPGARNEVLKDFRSDEMVIQSRLNEEQRRRVVYAMEELKLPTILAVHVALNTTKDLEVLPKPNKNALKPVSLGMQGRPGVGKSYMTAMIAIKEDCEILNLDPVSGTEATRYKQHMTESLTIEQRKGLTVERGWELANEVKAEVGSNKSKQPKTLRQMLDEGLAKFIAMKDRPKLVLCDMPGIPGENNYGTGATYGRERIHNIFDLVAAEGCESSVLSTHQLTEDTMQRKLNWIREEVIGKHLPRWQEERQEFVDGVRGTRV